MSPAAARHILTIVCPDTTGIVAAVAGYLSGQGIFIDESSHFGDPDTRRFFMRTRFTPPAGNFSRAAFAAGFKPIAERFQMDWQVHDVQVLPRVLLMVSRHDHCLNDLLYRYRTGALAMQIPAIVSNHMDLAGLAEWHRVPYFHVPVTPATKPQAEARLLEIIEDTKADLIVLARYMQVLSPETCRALSRAHHQHPPLVPAGLQGRQALPRGARARRETDRRHGALRDARSRRRPDHRADRRARGSHPVARGPRRRGP